MWEGVSQKDIYFFKRRLEAHPIIMLKILQARL